MVLFNYSTKELTAKVVYYGPGLCGKTTNLQWIHEKLPIKNKGKMLSLATETDRTLFFDFLPIEIGTVRGMRTRIQLYTVPGQVFYNATRRMVLKGADCVVFVCDSQEAMLDANLESFENLRQNLEANEINPDEIPIVFQFNKRDLPNALPIEIMNERLNPRNYPFYEAIALKGVGVEETLKGVTKLVFKSLSLKYGEGAPLAPPASNPVASRAPTAAFARAPAPPRANPPPPPPPAKVKKPTATIPPVTAEIPDDLLEHLDLDAGIETTAPDVVLEEEPAFPPPPARAVKKVDATMISNRSEARDLRLGITNPASLEFDLNLEEIEEEEEEVEEISLEATPLPSLDDLVPPVAVPPPARPMAPSGRASPAATAPRPSPAPAVRAEPPAPRTVPSNNPAPVVGGNSSRPVDVKVEVGAGETQVSVPIEIAIDPGTTKVSLNLRLTLNVKHPR
jgi:signal recognition particle receptor subunit beta